MQTDSSANLSTSPVAPEDTTHNPEQLKSFKTFTMIIYGLYALGLVMGGLPTIVGLIMAYVKRREYASTIYGLHLRFLIRTFWYGALWAIVGGILTLVYIGFAVLTIVGIWYIYRIVRGFLYMYDGKAPW